MTTEKYAENQAACKIDAQSLSHYRGKLPEIAEKIIANAKEAGVHIMEDPDLIELLSQVPVGDEIPLELYQAVAEVLAFVYRINGRYPESQPA